MRPRNSERGSHLPKVTQPKRTAESRQPRSSPEPPAVGRLPRWGHGSGCGAVKELHLHPSWLSPTVPKLGSLGGPSKAIYGAGGGLTLLWCCSWGPADASSTRVRGLRVEGMPPEGTLLMSSGPQSLLVWTTALYLPHL